MGDYFDFVRCQRADGSYYGTRGICRKGREVDTKKINRTTTKSESKKQYGVKAKYNKSDAMKRDMKNINVARGLKITRSTRGQADPGGVKDSVLNEKKIEVIKNLDKLFG